MAIHVTPRRIGAFEVEIWDRHVSLGTYLDSGHTLNDYEPEWTELTGIESFIQQGFDGRGMYCAVLDTGIDSKSPAIRQNFYTGISTIPGDGYICRRGAFTDSFYHGTATAGCVLQTMPGIRLINLKCFDQSRKHDNDIAWWVDALDWLYRWQKRKKIYGVAVNIEQTGDYVCAAAANFGLEGSPVSYPAAFDKTVMAVGSLRLKKVDGRYLMDLSPFSNYNEYIDFVALGEDFWTFLPNSNIKKFKQVFNREIDSGLIKIKKVPYRKSFQWMIEADGTSSASPAFAGIVAGLVAQYKQNHDGRLPDMETVRKLLQARAKEFTGSGGRKWLVPTMNQTVNNERK